MRTKGILAVAVLVITAMSAIAAANGDVVGMRRLSEQEYRNSIADIFGKDIAVQGMFEPEIRMGGLVAASTTVLSTTQPGLESFSKMADNIAAQITSEKFRGTLVSCTPKSVTAPDDACAKEFFGHYGPMLFRRPLTTDELKSRVGFANAMAKASGDFYTGLRYGLATMLQSPEFLFRKEVAVPAGMGFTLDSYSRASRLSFLLWNTTPDSELLHAAAAGSLNTQAGLDEQVARLMASPRLDMGMRAFFNDMLELDTFDTVSKDAQLYPLWGSAMATSAREETLRTTVDLALHQNGDMRDLMTTRKTFINRNLAAIYDVPFLFDGDWMPYEMPAQSGRSGVLTQVSMLSMFSHPGRSSPTKRGVALMDIFLCEPTPAPPNNVDFTSVNDPKGPLNFRQRLEAHATNKVCASCHTHSDPIGLSLEGFDTIGQRRLTENGQPIDVSATVQKKTFSDGTGVGQYLHDNPKYPACVARKLYAYSRGISSEGVRPATVKTAYQAFVDSGYRLRALIKGMAESPDFFDAPAPDAGKTPAANKLALR